MVRRMLRKLTGHEPDCSQSPDEAVVHGAALYAGMLRAQQTQKQGAACELINVNSHSLGVVGIHKMTGHKQNVVLIAKNTPLPAHARRTFRTAQPDRAASAFRSSKEKAIAPRLYHAGGMHRARAAARLPRNTPKSPVPLRSQRQTVGHRSRAQRAIFSYTSKSNATRRRIPTAWTSSTPG